MKKNSGILVIFLVLLISVYSCSWYCKKGEGKLATETRQISDFEELDIDGQAEVFIDQGIVPSLTIRLDSNLLQYIKTDVSGKKLKIADKRCIKNISDYKIYLTVNKLSRIDADGSVKIKSDTTIKSKNLFLTNRSSGEIQLNLEVDELEIDVSGSGSIKLYGRALEMEVDIDGAGSLDAYGLLAKEVDASVGGAGSCKINVSEQFYGNVGGSGKIFYRGNPKKVKTDISGSGTILSR